jgi:hypothetical protein
MQCLPKRNGLRLRRFTARPLSPSGASILRAHERAQGLPVLACGTFTLARMREEAANDKPVASAISLSEKASSIGATSR